VEVESFLNYLASERHVAASTQSQALNAVVFLYEEVLGQPLGQMTNLKRVQRRTRVPVVLTIEEVRATLGQMSGTPRLMAELIYGAGLRVHECVSLRVKDDQRCGSGADAGCPGPKISLGISLARLAIRISVGRTASLGKQWPSGALAHLGFDDSARLQASHPAGRG